MSYTVGGKVTYVIILHASRGKDMVERGVVITSVTGGKKHLS